MARNNSANLSRSADATSETAQYEIPSSAQRYTLYPLTTLSTGCELACPESGTAVRLMRCLRWAYTSDGTGFSAITSIRPPTNGKSFFDSSTTRGDCGMRPLNQGFTVCWSDEATSIGCVAISDRR